jgi:Cys-tRNA(Pro) deacylase
MTAIDIPITAAVRALRAANVRFEPHSYTYVERGGTRHAAESLGVDEHSVVKTMVMEAHLRDGKKRAVLVLMHGDCEVSTKELARTLQVKSVAPAPEAAVGRYTGYVPGGVSPFGTRTLLPIYVEETVLSEDRVYVNGGKRGFLVSLSPSVLTDTLSAVAVRVAIPERRTHRCSGLPTVAAERQC